MKASLLALTIGFATPVLAAELPISATYGTDVGCAIAADRGIAGDPEALFFVAPDRVVGFEYECQPTRVESAEVALSCWGEGEAFTGAATIRENRDGTLSYADESATLTLSRCE